VLGGGDGLAVREILKYPQIESITLVDLDPEMTRLFSTHPMLTALNQRRFIAESSCHQRRRISLGRFEHRQLRFHRDRFPRSHKLFARQALHHRLLQAAARHLSAQGLMVVQSTSPMFARDSYLVHRRTLKQAGLKTIRTTCTFPPLASGDSSSPAIMIISRPSFCRRVSLCRVEGLPTLFEFPPDMSPLPMPPNRLNDQVLVRCLRSGLEGHQSLSPSRRKFLQSASAALIGLSIKGDRAIIGTLRERLLPAGSSTARSVQLSSTHAGREARRRDCRRWNCRLSAAWRLHKKGFH
jgi:predicted membrane-bound spermidine synthase